MEWENYYGRRRLWQLPNDSCLITELAQLQWKGHLQFQENNDYRLVNSQVNSIVLMCLETLVEHEPRVNEITSQSTIVLRFEFNYELW